MTPGAHIIIGDDSPEYGHIYRRMLEDQGFTVTLTARNGLELLEQIKKEQPDIVIMEAHMKQCGAAVVLDSLNHASDIRMPGTIVTSLFYDECLEDELKQLGVNCFLKRPFEGKTLLKKVHSLLISATQQKEEEAHLSLFDYHLANIMEEIRVPCHLQNYEILTDAIRMRFLNGNQMMTKVVYPTLAKKYHKTWQNVEKGLRYFLDDVWNEGNMTALNYYFGKPGDTRLCPKPSNSRFIAVIAEHIKLLILAEELEK